MKPESRFEDPKSMARSKAYFDFHALEDLGVKIGSLVTDSRMVKPGDTFLAYAGEQLDARKFIPQAIAAGANAVLWERRGFAWDPAWQVPNLPVAGLRARAGAIADHVYGHPSQKLWLIGITGTNGKTSCSHWIAQAMTALGKKAAIIGTLGAGFPGELELTANTTPDAVLLHREMADYLLHGAQCVAMEVSSHGIVQGRISGSTFAIAVFTNLSQDHLDYHGSMETYAAAKARLFHWPGLKYAVLNLDDAYGVEWSQQLSGTETKVIGYGFAEAALQGRGSERFRMVRGRNLKVSPQGLEFDIEFESGFETEYSRFETSIVGSFNASNLLGVLAALLASGIKLAEAVRVLRQARPVAGRMEQMGGGDQPLVVVDYAHTPDALEKVLATLREMLRARSGTNRESNAKLICVFGCGGERDRGKRSLMGALATRLADEVIITSDNPRKEDPHAIIRQIVAGASANHRVEEDRGAAIRHAIQGAQKGDAVLIAGKGHEAYQEIDGKRFPFNDAEVARQVLRDLSKVPMQT